MSFFITTLLEIYPEADNFVLVGPSATYDRGEMVAATMITRAQSEKLLGALVDQEMVRLRYYYDQMSQQDRQQLPPFEMIIKTIQADTKAHVRKVIEQRLGDDESPYACDEFGDGNMSFKGPESLWHFYHFFGGYYESIEPLLNIMVDHQRKIHPLDVFDNPKYARLKQSLINYELAFSWHCTTTFTPSIVYRFHLDANAIVWLREASDVYDFTLLDDFALYEGETLLFSSCTHERHCHDILNKNPL